MNRLTITEAQDLQGRFTGRISAWDEPYPELRGVSRVLYPESTADVEKAVRLVRAAGRRLAVKSGFDVSAGDVGQAAAALAATSFGGPRVGSGAAVLSLAALAGVDVEGARVTVGPAATVADVAAAIADTAVFLPLDDSPSQSMASLLLRSRITPFVRSAPGLRTLSDAVASVEAVPLEGSEAGATTTLTLEALREIRDGQRTAVITKVEFDTSAWQAVETQRWTLGWVVVYERATFAALCDVLFGTPGGVPPGVDTTLRVSSAAFSLVLVVLRASGRGDADRLATEATVQQMLATARCTVLDTVRTSGAGASVAAWVTLGSGSGSPAGELPTRIDAPSPRPFPSFRDAFLDAVDLAVGVTEEGRERTANVRASAELQLMPNGDVAARAQVAAAKAGAAGASVQARLAAAIVGADAISIAPVALGTMGMRAPGAIALLGAEPLPEVEPTAGFDLTTSNRPGSAVIPAFDGEVFLRTDGGGAYRAMAAQYASSSYDRQTLETRMQPHLVAVPMHATDVVRAVEFAAARGLKVVARSGGHQYCGLSSGGDATIVLDMRRFRAAPVFAVAPDGRRTVTVGPGVRLHQLSTDLGRNRVTVPHGECPLVNIGGHVHTGGVGHQLRSLGLTVDWVRSFKMVTAVPGPGGTRYEEREFTKPVSPPAVGGPVMDDDVFGAVLGGGPGSWGVLTEVTFDLIEDDVHPTSHGYTRTYFYARSGFQAAMAEVREWSRRAQAGTLPDGVDLFVTAISGDLSLDVLLRPAVILIEAMCTEAAREPEIRAAVEAVEAALPLPLPGHVGSRVNGPAALSLIADAGVREIGPFGMPASGREFDLPYKKALYVTRRPLTPAFCDRFVDLVDRVEETDGLKVVVQVVVGGGKLLGQGSAATHMQRRDGLVQLVFDVFYDKGHEADAERFQAEMKGLLQEFSGGDALRMFWGTFEDAGTNGVQLDMRRPDVQALYFDSPAAYTRLQAIKAHTDPDGVFGNAFGVQLP